MDYAGACDLLFNLPRFDLLGANAVTPNLDNIRALLAEIGNPQEQYPTVHVAGTNGKGSVSSMLASILSVSGKSTGLHTSPHLFSLTERMRVDGRQAEEDWVASAVSRMELSIKRIRPSFFEASTALSFLYFADRSVDIAVIEVGMGGRLDATNVITPELSVITNIGLDHTQQLGETLPLIAREKAGIVKRGVPVVVGACQPEVIAVIQDVASELSAPVVNVCSPAWDVVWDGRKIRISTPEGKYLPFRLDLAGRHQWRNALVAAASASKLLPSSNLERTIIRGLSHVSRLSGIRARCEIVKRDPLVMVDVSHNEDGFRAALSCLNDESTGQNPPYVMLGLAADKDIGAILGVLAELDCIVMPVSIPGARGLHPSKLAQKAVDAGLRIVEIESIEEGWRQFAELAGTRDRLLVTGSHYLVERLPEEIFPRRAVSTP